MAAARLSAAALKPTVTFVMACAARTPEAGVTSSQVAGLMADQVNEDALELVRTKPWVLGLNGPPTAPADVKPAEGVMPNESGAPTIALMRLWPLGVPHPVQRS